MAVQVKQATEKLLSLSPQEVASIATPYLNGISYFMGGVAMMRRAGALDKITSDVKKAEQQEAITFYMDNILPRAQAELFVIIK